MLVIVTSLVLTGLATLIPIRDAPDGDRKTQVRPVPRTGGLAMGAAILIGFIVMMSSIPGVDTKALANAATETSVASLLVFVLGCALVGLVDDIWALGPKLKTGLLAALALLPAIVMPAVRFPVPGAEDLVLWMPLAIVGTALWLFVFVNASNFMDGANGIAFGSLAIMLFPMVWMVAAMAVMGHTGLGIIAALGGLSIWAVLGFLPWNLGGRIYAGDAGSLGLGAVVAVFGVVSAHIATVWFTAILALPFLVDVLLTLFWRARRGERLTSPHRDHAYQLFLRAGWKHWQVAGLWWVISGVCAGIAMVSLQSDMHTSQETDTGISVTAQFIGFLAALIVLIALWSLQRRWFSSRVQR